jgi:hypothetical protein
LTTKTANQNDLFINSSVIQTNPKTKKIYSSIPEIKFKTERSTQKTARTHQNMDRITHQNKNMDRITHQNENMDRITHQNKNMERGEVYGEEEGIEERDGGLQDCGIWGGEEGRGGAEERGGRNGTDR